YAGNQVIEERNGSDLVLKQYVYGNGIDELLRLDVYSGATSTPYYFHTNDIGSTTAITDVNGALVERVSYDTFGLPSFSDAAGQSIGASSIGNTILFQGREYESDINLYNYRARYYDSIMGRFLQTDPIGYQDSMNLYQGMNMNPGNYLDPWGEWTLGVHKQITEEAWGKYSGLGYPGLNMSNFKAGLIQGSTWPDVPEGYINIAVVGGFTLLTDWVSNKIGMDTKCEFKNMTYQSHYGDLQCWHSMQSEGNTKEGTREQAIGFISRWTNLAKDFLTGNKTKKLSGFWKGFIPGHFLGMALHVIEDSYCPAHTGRNNENWKIVKFNKYDEENKIDHSKQDERDYNEKTKKGYEQAVKITESVIRMFFNRVNNSNFFNVMKAYMLQTVFDFEN
ncbi:MAG: RHS repeat-associated core domain-containing protein, partial [Thermodesulfovibrionales bacterium]|nr:RHS repeat-associated core domain-containing protein [Thermodesulfovibrionales bacterium]